MLDRGDSDTPDSCKLASPGIAVHKTGHLFLGMKKETHRGAQLNPGERAHPGVANRLVILMKDRGDRCSAFARALGVATTTVSGWTSGTTSISAMHFVSIARVTNVSVDWLLLGDGDPEQPTYRSQSRSREALSADVAAYLVRVLEASLARETPPGEETPRVAVEGDAMLRELIEFGIR
ncbi:MAG: Bacteriophage repressor helix-turn-helix domain [Gemmatimonadetes bacterium]|nr:Bacteriophage repressor helix-turn-helix domain [Gemmatimonadota bacterium]